MDTRGPASERDVDGRNAGRGRPGVMVWSRRSSSLQPSVSDRSASHLAGQTSCRASVELVRRSVVRAHRFSQGS